MRAFLFPGQGSQSVGMGSGLAEASAAVSDMLTMPDCQSCGVRATMSAASTGTKAASRRLEGSHTSPANNPVNNGTRALAARLTICPAMGDGPTIREASATSKG